MELKAGVHTAAGSSRLNAAAPKGRQCGRGLSQVSLARCSVGMVTILKMVASEEVLQVE